MEGKDVVSLLRKSIKKRGVIIQHLPNTQNDLLFDNVYNNYFIQKVLSYKSSRFLFTVDVGLGLEQILPDDILSHNDCR